MRNETRAPAASSQRGEARRLRQRDRQHFVGRRHVESGRGSAHECSEIRLRTALVPNIGNQAVGDQGPQEGLGLARPGHRVLDVPSGDIAPEHEQALQVRRRLFEDIAPGQIESIDLLAEHLGGREHLFREADNLAAIVVAACAPVVAGSPVAFGHSPQQRQDVRELIECRVVRGDGASRFHGIIVEEIAAVRARHQPHAGQNLVACIVGAPPVPSFRVNVQDWPARRQQLSHAGPERRIGLDIGSQQQQSRASAAVVGSREIACRRNHIHPGRFEAACHRGDVDARITQIERSRQLLRRIAGDQPAQDPAKHGRMRKVRGIAELPQDIRPVARATAVCRDAQGGENVALVTDDQWLGRLGADRQHELGVLTRLEFTALTVVQRLGQIGLPSRKLLGEIVGAPGNGRGVGQAARVTGLQGEIDALRADDWLGNRRRGGGWCAAGAPCGPAAPSHSVSASACGDERREATHHQVPGKIDRHLLPAPCFLMILRPRSDAMNLHRIPGRLLFDGSANGVLFSNRRSLPSGIADPPTRGESS
jgi:hypothetical protein